MESSKDVEALPVNHTSYYEILGVAKDCTTKDIKTAYHRLLLAYHPDKKIQQNTSTANPHSIQYLQDAYKTLSDTEKRGIYDTALHHYYIKLGLNSSSAGSNINIDGIDRIDLSEFDVIDIHPTQEPGEEEQEFFVHACPRCLFNDGFVLSETDLEQGTQDQINDRHHSDTDYQILLQCASCSLWICVTYSMS